MAQHAYGDTGQCNLQYHEGSDAVTPEVPSGYPDHSLVWYYRSAFSEMRRLAFEHQGISDLLPTTPDELTNRTFGGAVIVPGSSRSNRFTLAGSVPKTTWSAAVHVLTQQTPTPEDYLSALRQQLLQSAGAADSFKRHAAWWAAFWDRSWLHTPTFSLLGRQAALQRYLDACTGRGTWPIRFNGQLFTAHMDPDRRRWGSNLWFQNTRLPYWNKPGFGDMDVVSSLISFYLRQLPLAKAKTRHYYSHGGAFFPETITAYGTYGIADYGCPPGTGGTQPGDPLVNIDRPPDMPSDVAFSRFIRYHWNSIVELSMLILDSYDCSMDSALLRRSLPIVEEAMRFFLEHYELKKGQLRIYPTQSLETFQCPPWPPRQKHCAAGSAPDIAGLTAIALRILHRGSFLEDMEQSVLPPLPRKTNATATVLTPAQKYPGKPANSETPELYAVFPFKLFTIATSSSEDLKLAIDTYHSRRVVGNGGWVQDLIHAALLGLTQEASSMALDKARRTPATGFRFPAFMPAQHDEAPNEDQMSVLLIALQYMLMQ
eukprot:gene2644-536_t